eukprot:gene11182-3240_t
MELVPTRATISNHSLGFRYLSESIKPIQTPSSLSESVSRISGKSKRSSAIEITETADTNTLGTSALKSPLAQDYVANQHFVTATHKLVLILSMKYWPHRVPPRVSHSTMNAAFGRIRIVVATATVFFMLYIMELAIREGRAARDGGEECLYNTPTARELQSRKRQWTREFEFQQAVAEEELRRARADNS